MKLIRLYAGQDGESHFQELELPLEASPRRANTPMLDAVGVSFGVSDALPALGWHHAPRRQLVAVLSGVLEIEIAGGSRARFGPGDTFLADDLAGRGHMTRDLEGPVRLLYVHLADDLDVTPWQA